MAIEVRIYAEGAARWVQASGTGGWATASAAATGLIGYVKPGQGFTSARTITTVMDRGIPKHHKFQSQQPIDVKFSFAQAVTANMANPATASGVSTPQIHYEIRSQDNEVAAASAQYFQFMNGVLKSRGWAEGEAGNEWTENWVFLSMTGPTASGYIF